MLRTLTFNPQKPLTFSQVPEGMEALVIADIVRLQTQYQHKGADLVMVVRDVAKAQDIKTFLGFFAPDIEALLLPAWDCIPYDRASPHAAVVAERMLTLSQLLQPRHQLRVLLLPVAAAMQRVPEPQFILSSSLHLKPGQRMGLDDIVAWLNRQGFHRTATVREVCEYAVRGGIIDVFPPTRISPVRLDFFGDTLESLRAFDAETQRTHEQLKSLSLVPVSEFSLDADSIRRFRQGYTATFGAATREDVLYHAVSEGQRTHGMEHWLPLFHEKLATVFEYVSKTPLLIDTHVDAAVHERLQHIQDYYNSRHEQLGTVTKGSTPYQPLLPAHLYLQVEEWQEVLQHTAHGLLSTFAVPENSARHVENMQGVVGHNFASIRANTSLNLFEALIEHIKKLLHEQKKVVLAAWSDGSRERLAHVLTDHKFAQTLMINDFSAVQSLPAGHVGLVVLPLEHGFETPHLAIISEPDIFGERLARARKSRKRASDVLLEIASLAVGDHIVHVEHGIGQFIGLKTIDVSGAPHDCLELVYAGGDKLYLPVENIDLVTRYGSDDAEATLDKLGGVAWQARKAKLKSRIREMAAQLIATAAKRAMREASSLQIDAAVYDEFCARFPYDETDDQLMSIQAVLEDLSSGKPMDRLVCGDVGFGKTEVALRAAFVAAMSGKQVAVVVPTTLLARQHFKTFSERMRGFPLHVAQASRLVSSVELKKTKEALAAGTIEIVVGTHALLSKDMKFKDLGLLIIDEEQHFGVAHKERLKELRADVHVLTLSATPIPRTLQLALTGVRDLSLIATPPVDRLAVRTFITPFDTLSLREALLREKYRGGQAFYVCPRIADLQDAKDFMNQEVPELKVAIAHGQMPPSDLDDIMTAFYEGRYDVLLSTTIVESGLDVPTANTLIVHRADMFGLAQLYQLKGRVGRSKTRAYALFTVPADKPLTAMAQRRLEVLQSLDSLGAGFQLASHDLDLRGSGNLLGDEQSGHIKEVGYELYQQMLEEAVLEMKAGGAVDDMHSHEWSPQITLGTPVLLPETYVADLHVRMGLYRRLGQLDTQAEIDDFAAELIDRFGQLPEEVHDLLQVVMIKALCRRANIERIDAGPKGAVLAFRHHTFANPAGLLRFIADQGSLAKVRPDQKVVFQREWKSDADRLKGVIWLLEKIVALAEA